LFAFLKLKIDKMSLDDRICVLCIDEMALKCNLFYSYGNDEIIGIEDDSIKKTNNPATSAVVPLARGIKSGWKQPLGYMFSVNNCSAQQCKKLLHKFIKKMSYIGLKVVGLITDMRTTYIQLSHLLGVAKENPAFTLGNKKLFYFFDPPHLLKAVRNNLLQNVILWNGETTDWKYIANFYESDEG
jgi:hypothetical protein